jgi:glycolate oxidase
MAERTPIIERLRRALPPHCLLTKPHELVPYECDGLSAYRQTPMVVALPETVEQLVKVVRACHRSEVPMVARGAGTGLSGGALPLAEGVLISLAKLNQILEIDPVRRLARVQPGVRNLAISEAAAEHGLFYAPDPSSQIACTIGGNVAENAGGLHCLKYGLTIHNVLRARIVTAEGDLLDIDEQMPGYNVLSALVGSEGLLGIVVEVTVKLLPRPQTTRLLLAAFDGLEEAGAAVGAIIAEGIIPAALELMDNFSIRATEDFAHCGYPTSAAAILLCELDGEAADVEEQVAVTRHLLNRHRTTEIRVAADEAERLLLWKGRKAAFPAMGRLRPDLYCIDGTIPRHRLPEVLARIEALSTEYGLPVANVFHAGDGNLHPLILFDANEENALQKTEALAAEILETCIAVGGTITGEHGVGVEKINQMCGQFNSSEIEQFHSLKRAFDPKSLLNPGKAIPTLKRCAEYGGLRIKAGKMPFPELERF